MRVRSLETLDVPQAWRRALWWSRERMEVPDRLPYEILDRMYPQGFTLRETVHLRELYLVMATKASGTSRPFARLHPLDLVLYQSLVDRLARPIEGALLQRDRVFGYRQSLELSENAFDGSPTWQTFKNAALGHLDAGAAYAVKCDVAGFFLQIDIPELEMSLLEIGGDSIVVRDLGELLRNWNLGGIRGIPQGVQPSSPLANIYLRGLDELLVSLDVPAVRYVDDLYAFADSFSEGRRIQDEVERWLYERGLTLSGHKSQVLRADTARSTLRTARDALEEIREEIMEGVEAMAAEDYVDMEELPNPEEVDEAAAIALYDEVVGDFRAGQYPESIRPALREVYRKLSAVRNPRGVGDAVEVVTRLPDLTGDAARYLAYVAEADEAAFAAFADVLAPNVFHRDLERLHLCRAALLFPSGSSPQLATRFGELALSDPHPLVRARALLAWGALGESDDFAAADAVWPDAPRAWQSYVVVSIQGKERAERDRRYEAWRSAHRSLDQTITKVQQGPFSWRKI